MSITRTTLLGTTIVTAAVLGISGCASTTGRPVGDRGVGVNSGPASGAANDPTPLTAIVDQRGELPADFDVSPEPGPVLPRSYDDALHTCMRAPRTSSQAIDRASAEAGRDGSRSAVAVNSTVTRYRSQAPVDRDAAMLLRPRAEQCFGTVLLRLFRQYNAGAGIVADRTTVRARSANEPGNVVAVVEFDFHASLGTHSQAHSTMTFVAGPRLLGCINFLGFGDTFDTEIQRRMTTAFAGRVARG